MKKSIIFIAVFLTSIPTLVAFSQGINSYSRNAVQPNFFMPQKELQPRYEKLPPIGNPTPNLSKRRYIIVDGRVMPLQDPIVPTPKAPVEVITEFDEEENIAANMADLNENLASDEQPLNATTYQTPATAPVQPVPLQENTITPPTKKQIPASIAPQITAMDPNLPNYRNRYNLYLTDLQSFQYNKQFPHNADLEQTLNKLNSNQNIVIFQDTLK